MTRRFSYLAASAFGSASLLFAVLGDTVVAAMYAVLAGLFVVLGATRK